MPTRPSHLTRATTEHELRQLYQSLLQRMEEERARVARQIHNELGQSLTAIKMALKSAQRQMNTGQATVEEHLQLTERLLDETIQTARRIATDLRPGLLDHFGLGAAVEWQIQQVRARSDRSLQLYLQVGESQITPTIATVVFRILQEALELMHHADVEAATVNLERVEDTLRLTVQASSSKVMTSIPIWPSLVVLGMHERAQSVGGSVAVTESTIESTALVLWLPLLQSIEDNS